ncbi:hypothetical protein BDZ45DRAFT_148459 [Acephala macrosclerotiorum]|nr:hypothetical protein BDZ45DRAFT_148459 [Acephala macrosclerotiorum]
MLYRIEEMENSVYQQLWGCCRCPFGSAGSFGLPSFIDFCTECQHRRCPDCPRERQKTLFHDVRLCPQSFQLNNSTESYPGTATNGIFTVPSTTQFIPQSHVGSLRDYQQEAQEAEDMRERQRPRRKRSHKHASASKTTSGNTFACHFCKRSPQQYNPWAGDDRYLKCLYPKPDGLRRIKDHFNQMHLLPYFRCIRCYTMFEDENDLHSHEYSTTCISAPSPPLDGIDIGQMRRIDVVLKARTDKWKTDAEKWLDIWAILFPGTRPPKSPCQSGPFTLSNISADYS